MIGGSHLPPSWLRSIVENIPPDLTGLRALVPRAHPPEAEQGRHLGQDPGRPEHSRAGEVVRPGNPLHLLGRLHGVPA